MRFTDTGVDIEKYSFRQIFHFLNKNIKHKKLTKGYFEKQSKLQGFLRESMVKSAGPE